MQKTGTALSIAVGLTFLIGVTPTHATTITLYDGTLQSQKPNNFTPQWLAFGNFGGTESYNSGLKAITLDTSNSIKDGYSNYNFFLNPVNLQFFVKPVNPQFPSLDRQAGYILSFRVQIDSETHTTSERAGFSVIAVSNDVSPEVNASIEIGFQNNRVFAQNDNFGSIVAEENKTFNPVGVGFVNYDLIVSKNQYQLLADGKSLLSGSLRNYINPSYIYQVPNFIFFGDDTTSAGAKINLQRVTLTTSIPEPAAEITSIPEPGANFGLLLFGMGGIVSRMRKNFR